MDRGPRTGVTGAVSASDLDFVEGGGAWNGQALRLRLPVYLRGWQRLWPKNTSKMDEITLAMVRSVSFAKSN